MTREPLPDDLQHLVDRYTAGETVQKLAAESHMAKSRLRQLLLDAGVLRTKAVALALGGMGRRHVVDRAVVVAAYVTGGESVDAIAERLQVHERVVHRELVVAGVEVRGQAAAQRARMAATSDEDRQALTARARAATAASGILRSPEVVSRRIRTTAKTRAVTLEQVGAWEEDLGRLLRQLGVSPIPQLAVGGYNIDLALLPIAVEVHVCASNPMTAPKLRKRVVQLADAGWTSLYVWITGAHPLDIRAAKYAVTLHQLAQGDLSVKRQCRVIRGSGEFVAAYSPNTNDRTVVPSTVDDPDLA